MANATARVATSHTPFGDNSLLFPLVTTAQTYYPGAFMGLNTSGYADKGDDAASLLFLGLVPSGQHKKIESGFSLGDAALQMEVVQPRWAVCKFSSVAITDVGKLCYLAYDNSLQLTTGTYGNVVGRIVEYRNSTAAVVQFIYTGSRGLEGAARTLAATGNQTITKWDLGKTIFVPNTATLTLTLPAVADTQPGDNLLFVKSHASDANAITLDGAGSETIDGSTTLATLDAAYDTAKLVSTGAAWIVAYRDIA